MKILLFGIWSLAILCVAFLIASGRYDRMLGGSRVAPFIIIVIAFVTCALIESVAW